ncbi:hypothetical protein T459_06565 [Capsicum annuum]|uniref:Reverse transcriptase/retrotransposon-derived protein RNase H-like domain-containing protein n=1 Tax=Capsicum annuum TaxID=4072 RepID=A0A2G3AB12_CAPAN|nr:hypothetical protein T459_06565 [Capsicum annuum]
MKMIQQNGMDKLLAKPAELCMMSVGVLKEYNQDGTSGSLLSMEPTTDECSHQEDLTPLLDQYNNFFEVPKGIPPAREQDHKITLQEGTSPINIRPYRYPIVQKDEIEKMVDEMLELGVIRHTMDGHKVDPQPTTLKGLRGFLGLASYYQRFIQGFGAIARPLNDLLNKGNFHWSDAASHAFEQIKHAITSAPVLSLRNFSVEFVVETDAFGSGI